LHLPCEFTNMLYLKISRPRVLVVGMFTSGSRKIEINSKLCMLAKLEKR
jgi:hypothetical protein